MTQNQLHRVLRPLLLLQICGFLFLIAGTHGAFAPLSGPPTTTDFSSFYTAGLLANQGHADWAYSEPALHAAEQATIAPGVAFNKFLNPPIFLLLCAPLAHLPYLVAFVLFEAVSGLAWLRITTRIAGGGGLATMALLCVPSVWWALGWGQNSFITASLFGLGTLWLEKRPWRAGAAFGALIFKPHFGILIPFVLLAGGHWRAIAGAIASVVLLCALTTLFFGSQVWPAFAEMALHARTAIESGGIKFEGHADLAGALRLMGFSAPVGWAAQAALGLIATLIATRLWWRNRTPAPQLYAVLIAATLLAMPFLLFYDLVLGSVAAAWLARAARQHGWQPQEATYLIAIGIFDFLAFPAAASLHLALGALVAPALLILALQTRHPESES